MKQLPLLNKILIVLFIAVAILFVIVSCTSCKAVKKITTSSHVDSIYSTVKYSVKQVKKDSTAIQHNDSTVLSMHNNTSDLSILFAGNDTSDYTGPVIIYTNGDTTVINAGGRKIQSINQKKQEQKKDSSAVKSSASVITHNNDSSSVSKGKTVAVSKTSSTKTIDKKKVSVVQIIFLIAIIAAVIAVWKYRSKILIFIKGFI